MHAADKRIDTEVLVVGAGPAGSVAARRLAERGHEVLLVDRSREPRSDIVCTGIVGREAFERGDLPEEAVVDVVRRARFRSPGGVEVFYEPRHPLAWVVDRSRFDRALAERAVDAGAFLARGLEAREVEKEEGGAMVRLRIVGSPDAAHGAAAGCGPRNGGPSGGAANGNGRYGRNGAGNGTGNEPGQGAATETEGRPTLFVRARALVVATGHQRWLHRQAGLGTPTGYVHGVHADLPFEGLDGAELYFGNRVAPGFFAWAIPFGPGEARLGVLSLQGSRGHFRRFLERPAVRSRLGLDLRNGGREVARAAVMSRGIVQGAVSPSFSDRVLAVGEAAGQVKTTTAGGIYYGMMGAEMAAEILSEGLRRDRLSAAQLSVYEKRWRARLGSEIRTGLDLQAAVRDMPDPEIDALFGALNDGLGAAVRQAVKFDWHRPALKILLRKLRGRGRSALRELTSRRGEP